MLRLAHALPMLVAGLSPLLAPAADAAIIQYATRGEWEAAVGSFHAEGFEGVPIHDLSEAGGTIATPGFDIVITGNHGGIGIAGVANHYFVGDSHCYEGGDPCSNSTPPGWDPDWNDIVFHEPITAFAVDVPFVEDADEDEGANEYIRLYIDGEVFHVPSQGFLGIASDTPFTLIRIGADRYYYHLDNVSFSPVPEPSTALLLGTGLVSIAAARRRNVQPR